MKHDVRSGKKEQKNFENSLVGTASPYYQLCSIRLTRNYCNRSTLNLIYIASSRSDLFWSGLALCFVGEEKDFV